MRATWIALAAILGLSLLGAYLLGKALERAKPKASLAPRGARVLAVRRLSDDQRVVTWSIGGHAEEPASSLHGLTIVEGQTGIYTHRAKRGSSGIRVDARDFTGDGRTDVLAVDDSGGRCSVYRLLVTAPGAVSEVATQRMCGAEPAEIRWNGRRLVAG